MNKALLKKNRLDLEFHALSQQGNALLILLTTGILSFIGSFLWLPSTRLYYYGISTSLAISLIGWFFYLKAGKRMREILVAIEQL